MITEQQQEQLASVSVAPDWLVEEIKKFPSEVKNGKFLMTLKTGNMMLPRFLSRQLGVNLSADKLRNFAQQIEISLKGGDELVFMNTEQDYIDMYGIYPSCMARPTSSSWGKLHEYRLETDNKIYEIYGKWSSMVYAYIKGLQGVVYKKDGVSVGRTFLWPAHKFHNHIYCHAKYHAMFQKKLNDNGYNIGFITSAAKPVFRVPAVETKEWGAIGPRPKADFFDFYVAYDKKTNEFEYKGTRDDKHVFPYKCFTHQWMKATEVYQL